MILIYRLIGFHVSERVDEECACLLHEVIWREVSNSLGIVGELWDKLHKPEDRCHFNNPIYQCVILSSQTFHHIHIHGFIEACNWTCEPVNIGKGNPAKWVVGTER